MPQVKAEPSEASAAVVEDVALGGGVSSQPQRPPSPEVDQSDPIYRAMMAAAASAPTQRVPGGSAVAGLQHHQPLQQHGLQSQALLQHQAGDRLLQHAAHDPHAALKSEHRNAFGARSSASPSLTPPHQQPLQQQPQQPALGAPPAADTALQRPPRPAFGSGRGKAAALTNMFGEDEDEQRTKRVLVSERAVCVRVRHEHNCTPGCVAFVTVK